MGNKEEIGIKIRTMRKSRGMTQADLAKAIEQSPSSITMYETGRREPDFDTLEALADAFNVSLFEFVPVAETDKDFVDDFSYTKPRTPEARIFARGIDQMPEEQRKALMTLMTGLYPGLFEKGTDHDDT